MANITLQHITPRNFYETVKALKGSDYRIYTTLDSIEIRFDVKRFERMEDTLERFDKLEYIVAFLNELANSSVPIELDKFIDHYSTVSLTKSFRRKKRR